MTRRHLTVLRSTLVGAELEGVTSLAPADHVKVFFPDPTVGEILTPSLVDGRRQMPAVRAK